MNIKIVFTQNGIQDRDIQTEFPPLYYPNIFLQVRQILSQEKTSPDEEESKRIYNLALSFGFFASSASTSA